jgi:hypothetical protein
MLFWGQDTGAVPAGEIQRFVVALQELPEIRRTKNNGWQILIYENFTLRGGVSRVVWECEIGRGGPPAGWVADSPRDRG